MRCRRKWQKEVTPSKIKDKQSLEKEGQGWRRASEKWLESPLMTADWYSATTPTREQAFFDM
jgi:hypothetical protein